MLRYSLKHHPSPSGQLLDRFLNSLLNQPWVEDQVTRSQFRHPLPSLGPKARNITSSSNHISLNCCMPAAVYGTLHHLIHQHTAQPHPLPDPTFPDLTYIPYIDLTTRSSHSPLFTVPPATSSWRCKNEDVDIIQRIRFKSILHAQKMEDADIRSISGPSRVPKHKLS